MNTSNDIDGHVSAPRRPPNLLLLFPDQHRGDWVGYQGLVPVRTPNVDALAARGVAFTQALCPSPLCAPARAVLATGRDYGRNPVRRNEHDLPLREPTMYRALREAGYHVATCGKLDLLKERKDWGHDGRHVVDGRSMLEAIGFSAGVDSAGKHDGIIANARGLPEPYFAYLASHGLLETHIQDYALRGSPAIDAVLGRPARGYDRGDGSRPAPQYANTAPTPLPEHAYVDNWIAATGLALLAAAPREQPWMLAVNFNGPHEPMDVTARMQARWRDAEFPLPGKMADLDPRRHQDIRRNYAAMIENIDRLVGEFIAYLERSGQLENTVVVYSSDHGDMLGEHCLWEKFVPYQPSVHVPLVFAGPGVGAHGLVSAPAAVVDLPATLLDLAGAALAGAADSRSLLHTLADPRCPNRDIAYSALGSWRLAFDGRYKLISGYDPGLPRGTMVAGQFDPDAASIALFDLEADALEEHDLAGARPRERRRLEEALRSWAAA